ncbi:DUF6922 domain-containing protein [Mucilaginibacter angelicae]|uniref:DUF6922 domain-containing protein n=1 Tax=Mucilaginibacter angelicae TaxID=869718 RepID=A0ABV6L9I1_9SPHI
MDRPILSRKAFCDVNMDNIDFEKDALFVMESVINNGSFEDFHSIRKFYGDKKMCETIIGTKELGPKEVNFCCLVFKLKPQDFIYPVKKYPSAQSTNYYGA